MLDQNQNFAETEDLKDIDESSEEIASDSADFTEPMLDKEEVLAISRVSNGQGTTARKMLEEYREERALRKAIYDDLYGFEEEE
jgi:hypothetical protein